MPERLTCECGCSLKNKEILRRHLRTEKHEFMMDNGGDLKAWQRVVVRRGIITDLQHALAKHGEGTRAWEQTKRLLDMYQAEEQSVQVR